jgi:putative peptidoglycan lipid II flippase
VIVPAAAGYVVLSRPLVAALLERGRFDAHDVKVTAGVLVPFALGLFGFSVYVFALRGFYALKDTRTPFMLNLVENGLNIVLAFALVGRLGVQGLGLAYALAYSVGAVLAVRSLSARVGSLIDARTIRSVGTVVLASAVMAVVVWVLSRQVGGVSGSGAIERSLVGVIIGGATYGALILCLTIVGERPRTMRR